MKKQSKNLLLLCLVALTVSGFSTSAIANPTKGESREVMSSQQQKKRAGSDRYYYRCSGRYSDYWS